MRLPVHEPDGLRLFVRNLEPRRAIVSQPSHDRGRCRAAPRARLAGDRRRPSQRPFLTRERFPEAPSSATSIRSRRRDDRARPPDLAVLVSRRPARRRLPAVLLDAGSRVHPALGGKDAPAPPGPRPRGRDRPGSTHRRGRLGGEAPGGVGNRGRDACRATRRSGLPAERRPRFTRSTEASHGQRDDDLLSRIPRTEIDPFANGPLGRPRSSCCSSGLNVTHRLPWRWAIPVQRTVEREVEADLGGVRVHGSSLQLR